MGGQADEDIKRGLACLTGIGQPKDEGMAAANFLNALDRGSSDGIVASAIIYFVGIGVARDSEKASEYANLYLSKHNKGPYSRAMSDITDGSLGAANAKRVLLSLGESGATSEASSQVSPVAVERTSKKNSKVFIAAGAAGIGVLILLVFVGVGGSITESGTLQQPVAAEKLFSAEELKSARQQAQSIAGIIRNEARQNAQ